jgi:hypothetical protein
MDSKWRKSRSCCCVGPSEPEAMMLRINCIEIGENTMLFLLEFLEKRCSAIVMETFVWLAIDLDFSLFRFLLD